MAFFAAGFNELLGPGFALPPSRPVQKAGNVLRAAQRAAGFHSSLKTLGSATASELLPPVVREECPSGTGDIKQELLALSEVQSSS